MRRFLGYVFIIGSIIAAFTVSGSCTMIYAQDGSAINITDSINRTLEYDDQLSVREIVGGDYVVASIENENISSYQVEAGSLTTNADTAVVALKSGSDINIRVAGIGTAKITVVEKDKLDTARKIIAGTYDGGQVTIDAVQINVNAVPARLTMLFVAGGGSMQGICTDKSGYHPEDSVAAPVGEVYSTYAPSSDTYANNITGSSLLGECTTANAGKYVAGNLCDDISISGDSLMYSTDALTTSGVGKAGIDGALAYEWNKLSGDKVWIINASAEDGTSAEWNSNGASYKRAKAVFEYAVNTASAEIAAGHYVAGNRIMYWLQGEKEEGVSVDEYAKNFASMYTGMESATGFEKLGIIPVRSSMKFEQYMIIMNSAYPKACIATNINEKWTSDKRVEAYFKKAYASGKFDYSLRQAATIKEVPTKLEDVTDGTYYSQIAHNENGIDASMNMYYIFNNSNVPQSGSKISWRDADGKNVSQITMGVGQIAVFEPYFSTVYNASEFTYTLSGRNIKYDKAAGTYLAVKKGNAKIIAKDKTGAVVATLHIKIKQMQSPDISLENTSRTIELSWKAVNDADKYIVYRKTGKEKWKKLKETTELQYTDKKVKAGVTYSYKVTAHYSRIDKWSAGKVKRICRLAPMSIKKAECIKGGIKLSWNQAKGAKGYYVYRKNSKGRWSKIATVKGGRHLDYTDRKVSNGTVYQYKVISYNGAYTSTEKVSYYWAYLSPVKVTGLQVDNTNKSVTSWSRNAKASGYEVEVTTGTGTRIINTGSNSILQAQFYALGSDKKIKVRVRAYIADSNGVYYSAWSSAKSISKD